jgi:hypothetical protein
LDEYGTPSRGSIDAVELTYGDGRLITSITCSVGTDSQGYYRCPQIPAGDYVLFARYAVPYEGETRKYRTARFAYFPGTAEMENATVFSLRPDSSNTLTIRRPSSEGFTISGTLPDRPANPQISLLAVDGCISLDTGIHTTYRREAGTIALSGVPDGDYSLNATWHKGDRSYTASRSIRVSGADLNGVTLSAVQSVDVVGTLQLLPTHTDLPATVFLSSLDGNMWEHTTQVDQRAQFRFEEIPLGRYTITLDGHSSYYVQNISLGGRELPQNRLILDGSNDTVMVDVSVAKGTGALAGRVESDKDDNRHHTVVIESEDLGTVRRVNSARDGSFICPGLPPGAYRIYAWRSEQHLQFRNAEFLRLFRDESTEAIVEPNAITPELSVPLIVREPPVLLPAE